MTRIRAALSISLAGLMSLTIFVGVRPAGAADSLISLRTARSLTGIHQWYRQTYGGHPVLGAYYARHLDARGHVVAVSDGRLPVSGSLPASAAVSAASARHAAGAEDTASAELVVLPGRARLSWAVYSTGGYRSLVDAVTGVLIRRDVVVKEAGGRKDTGTGKVFDPNPVVTLQDESLTDQKDADYAALQPAYFIRTLTHLDGSGFLRGDFADVKGTTGRAKEKDLQFVYGRTDDRFEQTMAYYDITGAQEYIQSLGFDDVNNEPQNIKADQFGGDNSFYYPKQDYIKLGKGGVDDAEDAEVTWHEYGHAIQDDQVPDFGEGHDAGSIGEGFGDYWAVSMSQPVSNGFDLPCVADWDSTSYIPEVPHCLRRTDLDLTVDDQNGRIHHDGQIWSRALWDVNQNLGRDEANTIILEAQFFFAPDTSFRDAALNTVDVALDLYGQAAETVVRQAFEDRGIL
jgi:hypothetical protein